MQIKELVAYHAIPAAAWARLSRAANNPADPMRLMAVATVAPDHKPSNRMLVIRGADRASGLMWFHTDRRSPKVHHLKELPYLSALGYDSDEQLQLRVDGSVTLHQNDALADRHWEQVSMALKHTYGLPHAPGETVPQPDPRAQAMRSQQKLGMADHGRHNFVVIEMKVDAIDWLQIGTNGQIRALLRAAHDWKAEPLVP